MLEATMVETLIHSMLAIFLASGMAGIWWFVLKSMRPLQNLKDEGAKIRLLMEKQDNAYYILRVYIDNKMDTFEGHLQRRNENIDRRLDLFLGEIKEIVEHKAMIIEKIKTVDRNQTRIDELEKINTNLRERLIMLEAKDV